MDAHMLPEIIVATEIFAALRIRTLVCCRRCKSEKTMMKKTKAYASRRYVYF
jgi:hypothetical protein